MNVQDININQELATDLFERLPYFYPTNDQEVNMHIEGNFFKSVKTKILTSFDSHSSNYVSAAQETSVTADDPIFGNKYLTSSTIFPEENSIFLCDGKTDLDFDPSTLDEELQDSAWNLDQFEDKEPSLHGENPFLSTEDNNFTIETNGYLQTSCISVIQWPKKQVKITDWLAQNDKEWIDSVLSSSTLDNITDEKMAAPLSDSPICHSSSLKNICNVGSSDPYNNLKIELVSPRVKNQSNMASTGQKTKLSSSGIFSSFLNSKKEKSTTDSQKKASFWSRIFKRNKKSHSFSETNPISFISEGHNMPNRHFVSSKIEQPAFNLIYFFMEDSIPFRSRVSGLISNYSFQKIKSLLPLKKNKKYRFYFKNVNYYDDAEQVFFDEIVDDDQMCPYQNDEIVCKIVRV